MEAPVCSEPLLKLDMYYFHQLGCIMFDRKSSCVAMPELSLRWRNKREIVSLMTSDVEERGYAWCKQSELDNSMELAFRKAALEARLKHFSCRFMSNLRKEYEL